MPASSPPAAPVAATAHGATISAGSESWRRWAGVVLIVAIVTVVYWPALHGAFILDDRPLVTENPIVRAPNGLYWFWFTTNATDYWPVTNSSFWLEWRLWGTNPTGYHITNLLLHLAATFLIWAILRRLAIPGAFLAALLFAVHPVNVESVAWISQRKNTLAMVFFLLSILWYLPTIKPRTTDNGQRITHWYWLSLLAFVLAMLSKGSVAVLPVVLLVIVWWQRRRVGLGDLARTAPFFLVAIVLTAVNVWFQKHGQDVVVRDVTFLERLAGAGAVVWFYLCKALAPIHLVFVYPNWQIEGRTLLWWLPLAAALVLSVLLARKSRSSEANWGRALLFGWLVFGVGLVPVLGFTDVGFMQYSLVADHYQHIALIAVAALIAAGLSVWRWQGAQQSATMVAAVGLVGVLSFLTWQQNRLYRGPLPLYQATLEENPESWVIHNEVGVALRRIGRTDEALGHYKEALRLRPAFADAHYNFGNALLQMGQTQNAIDEFRESLRLDPKNASAHDNLGSVLAQMGRLPEAIDHFQQSLHINSNSAITHNNLASALLNNGHASEAIKHYREAIRLRPGYTEAYLNLANAFAQAQQGTDAIATAEKGLEVARSQGQTPLADEIADWLKEYRASQSLQHPALESDTGHKEP